MVQTIRLTRIRLVIGNARSTPAARPGLSSSSKVSLSLTLCVVLHYPPIVPDLTPACKDLLHQPGGLPPEIMFVTAQCPGHHR